MTTQTIAAPATTATVSTSTLLRAGSAAGPLFLGLGLIQGFTRGGFDFTRNAISQLSLGDLGWIQVTSFALTGALTIAGAVGLRRALAADTRAGRWVPRLIGLFGVSFLVAGTFKADAGAGFPAGTPTTGAGTLSWHGAVHMLSGMVGYLALCVAFFLLARHFAVAGQRGWAVACRAIPIVVLAGFMGSASAVLLFTAGANLGLLWMTAVTARLASRTQ